VRFRNFQNCLTNKPSFFEGSHSSQNAQKLAVIPRFCYIIADLGGVELPPHTNLRTDNFSQSAGEKRAKPLLQRLTTPFGRVASGVMLASTMALSPMAASAQNAPVQTASVSTEAPAVPSVPMSERMEISERAARTVAATGSKDGIVFLVYGENQWLIDELSFAIYEGHQKGRAVKGIALGSSTAPDGFDVYVNGHRIAEARDVANTDVRGGATYAIEYGQQVLDTRFSSASVERSASLNP